MKQLFFDEHEVQAAKTIQAVSSQSLRLRDYQMASVDAVYEEWKTNQSTLLVLPTGTGKSVCFSEVMRRWQGERILLMAHRKELIYQAVGHAKRAGLTAGIEMAHKWASGKEDVIVSTVQTLMAGMKCQNCFGEGCDGCDGVGKVKRITRFSPHDFGLITIDEAHHAVADTYRTVIKWFQRNEESKLLLVTATPNRTDKKGMRNVCDSVAYQMMLKEAIDLGWLVPIRQRFVTVNGLDLSEVKISKGDLASSGVEKAFLGTKAREERLLHAVAKPTLEEARGKQVIVFSSGKEHAKKITAAFNSYEGVTAAFVTESTATMDRDQIVSDFRNGRIQVLVNCMVFTEGFDCPSVSVVANCRPTKSESLYSQIIGRATRPLPGVVDGPEFPSQRKAAIASSDKPCAVVLDFVGNSGRHKLVSVLDVLAGDAVDPIDLDAALEIAKQSHEPVDMEALAEKVKTAREESERRQELRKAKCIVTQTYAIRADYTAVDVDLFAGAEFGAYNDPTPASGGQRWLLKEFCGVPWRKSENMCNSEANSRIKAAKQNAKKVWESGMAQARTKAELRQIGVNLEARKSTDRLINSEYTLSQLREAYRQRMRELNK